MGRRPKHVDEVERLLDSGYSVKDIIRTTNISQSTVYRVVDKLKKEARYDFKHLMEHDYLWKYQKTIQNLDLTIKQCNEEIETIKQKYNSLEIITMNEFENLPDAKASTKALLLGTLATIQSNRTNEMIKLCAQRDKASEIKAKTYNQGPVVNAIDEWVNGGTAQMGELPRVKELDSEDIKPSKLNKKESKEEIDLITDEESAVLREMEDDR